MMTATAQLSAAARDALEKASTALAEFDRFTTDDAYHRRCERDVHSQARWQRQLDGHRSAVMTTARELVRALREAPP